MLINPDDNFITPNIEAKNANSAKQKEVDKKIAGLLRENEIFTEGRSDQGLENLQGQIELACPKHLQLKESDPFFGENLLVFKDDYKGLMPLNGIRKSELDEFQNYYEKIFSGATPFVFEEDGKNLLEDSNNETLKLIKKDIKSLMTRKTGRAIFDFLLNSKITQKITILNEKNGDSTHASIGPGNANICLNYGSDSDLYVVKMDPKTGKKVNVFEPTFLTLGHELIHAIHLIQLGMKTFNEQSKQPPTTSLQGTSTVEKMLHNMEEQTTILGLRKNIEFKQSSESASTASEDAEWADYEVLNYDDLNENSLLTQFGLLPRISHEGLPVRKKPADLTDKTSIHFQNYVAGLIQTENIAELGNILEQGFDINQFISFDKRYPKVKASLLEQAIRFKKNKVVDFLIKKNASLLLEDANGGNCCFWALEANELDLLDQLVTHGADPHHVDAEGNNLAHLAAKNKENSFLSWVAMQGVDLSKKNSMGLLPIYLANSEESLELFKKNGVDFLKTKNNLGQTKLHIQHRNFHEYNQDLSIILKVYPESKDYLKTTLDNYLQQLIVNPEEKSDLQYTIEKIRSTLSFLQPLERDQWIKSSILKLAEAGNLIKINGLGKLLIRELSTNDCNFKDKNGTPLSHHISASRLPFKEKIQGLLSLYEIASDVNKRFSFKEIDTNGNTFLHILSIATDELDNADYSELKELEGACGLLKNHAGKTAVDLAKSSELASNLEAFFS